MTTIDILEILAEQYQISEFRLVKFKDWKYLQEYLTPTKENQSLITHTQIISEKTGLSFWDSALLSSSFKDSVINNELINLADHHNSFDDEVWMPAKDLRRYTSTLEANWGINSIVKINGNFAHIPMLDFHISVSDNNTRLVTKISHLLTKSNNFILNSGKSYHLIGRNLIDAPQLMTFLARAILYGPITDVRWIAHQIIERSCTLRIGKKNGKVPNVILEDNIAKHS